MVFERQSDSCLSYPYNLFVNQGSKLELNLLFDDSDDLDSLFESEPILEDLERDEYIKSLFWRVHL